MTANSGPLPTANNATPNQNILVSRTDFAPFVRLELFKSDINSQTKIVDSGEKE
jgi:hypothetical protein